MARPKVPLISKRKTLEAALKIIDAEGLGALSVRRLAVELEVNAASLYHHFQDKEEILIGAAMLALDEVRTPVSGDEEWQVWLLRNADRLRRALVAHPDLIPILMRRDLLVVGAVEIDATAALLAEQGVPQGAIVPMIEFGELLAIVYALAQYEHAVAEPLAGASFPNLRKVSRKRALQIERLFAVAYQAGVDAIVADAKEAEAASASAPSRRRRAAAAKKPRAAAQSRTPTARAARARV